MSLLHLLTLLFEVLDENQGQNSEDITSNCDAPGAQGASTEIEGDPPTHSYAHAVASTPDLAPCMDSSAPLTASTGNTSLNQSAAATMGLLSWDVADRVGLTPLGSSVAAGILYPIILIILLQPPKHLGHILVFKVAFT